MILHAPARPNASPDQAAAKALYLLLLSLHGGGWRPRISLKVMCVVASAYRVVCANRLALHVSFSRSLHDAHRTVRARAAAPENAKGVTRTEFSQIGANQTNQKNLSLKNEKRA